MFKLHYTPTYAFDDDQMVTLFLLLNERGMLQFPTNPRSEEAGKPIIPCCLYHQNLRHSTNDCYTLKNKIQVLIEAKVIQLKSELKRVISNMVTLTVRTNEFLTGATPIPTGMMVLVII